ncbi:hypothetical protein QCA50_019611 [Cerrena zonata]|uniref:Uncharacterized protein n=1 Tax=Cerrena zonata TaxID=2478898 RepID=A0AAW0FAI1_9APHY
MLIQLPEISKTPDFQYSQQSLPQLVGDLAQLCQLVLIQPHITDKELIYTLFSSNLYHEHHLDVNFKKSVAEISVKQSRLLQINSPRFKYKEIAIRNYLINLAAAATTAYEYKLKTDALKKTIRLSGDKKKISKDEKKKLWEQTIFIFQDLINQGGSSCFTVQTSTASLGVTLDYSPHLKMLGGLPFLLLIMSLGI